MEEVPSVLEVRNLLKVDRSMIYKLLMRGELPAFKLKELQGSNQKGPLKTLFSNQCWRRP